MEVPVLNQQGKEIGKMSIDEASLGGCVNPALIKQAYVRYHANQRQGSARTKSRGMVEGSTRKLFRQKGTGRARMGAVRTNLRKGGGVTFAKTRTREDFRKDMPVKMRRKANRNALLAKLLDGEVKVLDTLAFDSPKTSDFLKMLDALGINRTCLVALNMHNTEAILSSRNIKHVDVCPAHELTVFNMLNHRFLVIAKSELEKWLSGPSSRTDKSAKAGAQKGAN
ncbi:MAG: 50S ribosomal protein L4 [Phycisphaeraceae bacterium]|nr:50S ribosomal protein L4 [Phycisphaeraceae bacterium]MCB9847278.1 50S ribosomal protein L4 [Phycisphaeraceae bacterium]